MGYETGPRVGQALGGLDMLSRGWHSGTVFGPLAAAAAAGSLDAAGVEDAFGIAATQAGGLMSAQFESMVKLMQHGFASRNGLTAVALAAPGYVGIKRVFEREYGGYLAAFGEGHHPDAAKIYEGHDMTARLGRPAPGCCAPPGRSRAARYLPPYRGIAHRIPEETQ